MVGRFDPWIVYRQVQLHRAVSGGAYTYVTDHVALDADGSPRAYHPQGKGIDDNRNAGYPDGSWRSILVQDPVDPDRPYVQREGPGAGYFLSKTSLQDGRLMATDPARYVDSEAVPYLVFPGAFYALAGTGAYGDLAMVRSEDGRFESFAIVADGGPRDAPLGEMSLKLAVNLGGQSPNPRNGRGAPRGRFRYMVFPGSRAAPPWRRDLVEMEQAARALLHSVGGWP